ncbi:MAG TPA: copper chaperone [Chloroflexi bacterium]|nr:copper chaperone [Chloroflexota bacterium]
MALAKFEVPNISCGHCVHTIQMELRELAGVKRVEASLSDRRVEVEFEPPATEEAIVAALIEINYPPAKA